MTEATARKAAVHACGGGLFVSHSLALGDGTGGLQLCTDEYVRTLRAAGVDLSIAPIEHDRRTVTRLVRRLSTAPYPPQWRQAAVDEIAGAASRTRARFVFLNLVNLAPLAAALRSRLARSTEIVLLSHGLESVDYLHTIPLKSGSRREEAELGRRLLDERRHRTVIDRVFCLSEWEADIERWLGGRRVTAVPRTLADRAPLDWTPDPLRLGFVGTLDHPPTADSLEQFLTAFQCVARDGCQIRVVGGPVREGEALASRFRTVEYLGALPDADLEREASTWSAFVHPMFSYARGCSTKLAVALAWRIPVVTTAAGARGYVWRDGTIPMADAPDDLARLACAMTERANANSAREGIVAVARSMPSVNEVGRLIARALAE